MRHTPATSTPTAPGPAATFTGTVLVDAVRSPDEQSAIGCAHVRFAPRSEERRVGKECLL